MNKPVKIEYFFLFATGILFFILLYFFYLHQGSVLVDVGREFYIPSKMTEGQVLYKDILNIYGALGYQINAVLFLLFGEKITTLYHFGILNSFVLVFTIYFLSREFLEEQKSFLITVLTMFTTVFTGYIFNTNMPYSFSFVYALTAFLLSSFFLIRYVKTSKNVYALLSSLLSGLSIASKADFAPAIFVLIFVFYFFKPLDLKNKILSFICFLSIPAISTSVLFFQGLSFDDIKNTISLIIQMTHTDEFEIFYKNALSFTSIFKRLVSAAIIAFIFVASKYKAGIKNDVLNYVFGLTLLILISFLLLFFNFIALSALPLILILLFVIKFKEIYNDKPIFVLALLTIVSGIKFSFYINVEHFGAFILPLFTLTFIILLKYVIKDEKYYGSFISLFLISIICTSAAKDFYLLQHKNYLLKTPKGEIYTTKREGTTFDRLKDFINKNLNKNEKILVLPEGAFMNFALSQNSDSKYYSLIPLYVGMFKEQTLIDDFSKDLPEYIVISNLDESDFGKQYICINYAQEFCKTILSHYKTVAFFDKSGYKMFVYKKSE